MINGENSGLGPIDEIAHYNQHHKMHGINSF